MELTGLHHVSSITGNAPGNIEFYTKVLGLRLVKKTVNQDDVSAYHFFYGDRTGSPGTEVTFFDWPGASPNRPGSGSISKIALSVPNADAVDWWAKYLNGHNVATKPVTTFSGLSVINFSDPEGQKLSIVGQPSSGTLWENSPIPTQVGISGMHHVTLTVRSLASISRVLVDILRMRQIGEYDLDGDPLFVFETGEGGAGKQVHVVETPNAQLARVGAGGVHHVAFRVTDVPQQEEWLDIVRSAGLHSSGLVDRFYFSSIYFREPGGILFEIATDGPGFAADEDPEHLGERLSLPPFLEPRRAAIEAGLVPV